METPTSPLAHQLAGLRAATQANPHSTMLPAALHALIMACLARIFARLEQILILWQSGQLVAAPVRHAPNAAQRPHPASASRQPAPAAIPNHRRHPRIGAAVSALELAPTRHHHATTPRHQPMPGMLARPLPPRPAVRRLHPHAARAPPIPRQSRFRLPDH